MELVLAGKHSKNIAFDLGIGQRTVKTHRARIKGSRAIRANPGRQPRELRVSADVGGERCDRGQGA